MDELTASKIATILNVSERTVYNHRSTLEAHYNIDLTERVGRRSLFKQEYLGLLRLSILGGRLPDSPDSAPAWTIESESTEQHTETEVKAVELVDYVVEIESLPDLKPITVDLDTVNLSMVDRSTATRLDAFDDLRATVKKLFLHTVAQDADTLKAQAKELYANAFAQAGYETLTELIKRTQQTQEDK